jgi:hypothetical protein
MDAGLFLLCAREWGEPVRTDLHCRIETLMAFLPLAARDTDKFVQSVTRRT